MTQATDPSAPYASEAASTGAWLAASTTGAALALVASGLDRARGALVPFGEDFPPGEAERRQAFEGALRSTVEGDRR